MISKKTATCKIMIKRHTKFVVHSNIYSSLSNKRDDGIKVVRGQNLKIKKRGGGISMGKEITLIQSILKLEECLKCQNLAKSIPSSSCFITSCSNMNGFFTI